VGTGHLRDVQAKSSAGGVDRLTDTSKYTGSHKERFDESGKGKGAAGRSDTAQNTGYVGNYKGAGSYDKTHDWDAWLSYTFRAYILDTVPSAVVP